MLYVKQLSFASKTSSLPLQFIFFLFFQTFWFLLCAFLWFLLLPLPLPLRGTGLKYTKVQTIVPVYLLQLSVISLEYVFSWFYSQIPLQLNESIQLPLTSGKLVSELCMPKWFSYTVCTAKTILLRPKETDQGKNSNSCRSFKLFLIPTCKTTPKQIYTKQTLRSYSHLTFAIRWIGHTHKKKRRKNEEQHNNPTSREKERTREWNREARAYTHTHTTIWKLLFSF